MVGCYNGLVCCFGDFEKFVYISLYCVSALSLHIESTNSMITCLRHFFSSRGMPELRFAITQPEQKSVLTVSIIIRTIDSDISYTSGSIG